MLSFSSRIWIGFFFQKKILNIKANPVRIFPKSCVHVWLIVFYQWQCTVGGELLCNNCFCPDSSANGQLLIQRLQGFFKKKSLHWIVKPPTECLDGNVSLWQREAVLIRGRIESVFNSNWRFVDFPCFAAQLDCNQCSVGKPSAATGG